MSTLDQLPVGGTATVDRVGGDRHVRRRLLEMGLLPGTSVRVIRRAPMGDPVELRLRGYSLSVRGADAVAIALALDLEAPEARAELDALSPAE